MQTFYFTIVTWPGYHSKQGPCQQVLRTPAEEFELALIQVPAGTPFTPEPGRGVEVLLGIEGDCVLLSEDRDLALGRGRAVFVPASLPSYQIGGEGRVARARVPA